MLKFALGYLAGVVSVLLVAAASYIFEDGSEG